MSARSKVVVVGAGIAGLTVAGALASSADVTMIDRLPAAGGVLGYEHPAVRAEAAHARAGGVRSLLGTTALRWVDSRLLVAGPNGIEWLSVDRLVYAGGARPAVPSELRLLGPRVAGVVAATVAVHLAEAEVSMGRSVCLVGISDWAERAARIVRHQGARVTVVSTDEGRPPDYGDQWWMGWRAVAIEGTRRVSALIVARGDSHQRITCDTLILAGDSRPLRNVDGAIADAPGVEFAQRTEDRQSIEDVRRHSLEIAGRVRNQLAAS